MSKKEFEMKPRVNLPHTQPHALIGLEVTMTPINAPEFDPRVHETLGKFVWWFIPNKNLIPLEIERDVQNGVKVGEVVQVTIPTTPVATGTYFTANVPNRLDDAYVGEKLKVFDPKENQEQYIYITSVNDDNTLTVTDAHPFDSYDIHFNVKVTHIFEAAAEDYLGLLGEIPPEDAERLTVHVNSVITVPTFKHEGKDLDYQTSMSMIQAGKHTISVTGEGIVELIARSDVDETA